MRRAAVVGVGMTPFGRYFNRSLRDLAGEAVRAALDDAGMNNSEVQAAYVGNSVAGITTGQEAVRGQVSLLTTAPRGIPIFNVENACASSATAFHLACIGIGAEQYDCALVVGLEKLHHEDRSVTSRALRAAADLSESGDDANFFVDRYAKMAAAYSERSGATSRHYAMVAAKNRSHGALNPYAQYQQEVSLEEVLDSPIIVPPLTRFMCSPIGDGATATLLVAEHLTHKLSKHPVWVEGSAIASGGAKEPTPTRVATVAYERSGIGPEDLDVAEVHDGSAPAELQLYEHLGLCPPNAGAEMVERGETQLGGRIPVNTGGGLLSRGHPVGATGVAQVIELVWQLRGDAGERQVPNAKVGLAENAGGWVGEDTAAGTVHILAV